MRIALFGHGRMGRIVEALAAEKGHSVITVITRSHSGLGVEQLVEAVSAADVAIDFSTADAVQRNVETCLAANVPLIEGTTGWNDRLDAIRSLVEARDGAMVFGANFSIGVNLFYKVAEYAAELFANFPEYEAFIEEQHHSKKKDAPSGTALQLKGFVEKYVRVNSVVATRAGSIPGTHRLGFDSFADQVLLTHTARSRDGFASGAVAAAEWVIGRKGFYEFPQVIDEVIGQR